MPVHRYKQVEDMPPPRALPALHTDTLRQAFLWSALVARLAGWKPTPGIHRRDLRDPPPEE